MVMGNKKKIPQNNQGIPSSEIEWFTHQSIWFVNLGQLPHFSMTWKIHLGLYLPFP